MIAICASYQIKYAIAKTDLELKKQKIAEMEIAEKVAEEYDATVKSYNIVKAFVDTTHTDNVMLLTFLNDLERVIPTGTTIDKLVANDGIVEFEVETHSKEAVADTYVNIQKLEYVDYVLLPEIVQERLTVIDEQGNIVVEEEEQALRDAFPYNYSEFTEKYKLTVKIRDLSYTPGQIETEAAIPSDENVETVVEEGGEE